MMMKLANDVTEVQAGYQEQYGGHGVIVSTLIITECSLLQSMTKVVLLLLYS